MTDEYGIMDMLKGGLLAGLGAAVVTKRKVEEITQGLVEQGRLSAAEAEKLGQELLSSGREQWEELEKLFQGSVKQSMDGLGVARQDEFRSLTDRVSQLEQKVDMLLARAADGRKPE